MVSFAFGFWTSSTLTASPMVSLKLAKEAIRSEHKNTGSKALKDHFMVSIRSISPSRYASLIPFCCCVVSFLFSKDKYIFPIKKKKWWGDGRFLKSTVILLGPFVKDLASVQCIFFMKPVSPMCRYLSIYNVPSSLIVVKTFLSLLFKENRRFRLWNPVILAAYLTKKKFTIKIRNNKSKEVRIQTMKGINQWAIYMMYNTSILLLKKFVFLVFIV